MRHPPRALGEGFRRRLCLRVLDQRPTVFVHRVSGFTALSGPAGAEDTSRGWRRWMYLGQLGTLSRTTTRISSSDVASIVPLMRRRRRDASSMASMPTSRPIASRFRTGSSEDTDINARRTLTR